MLTVSNIFEEFELPPLPTMDDIRPAPTREFHLPPLPTMDELNDPDYDTETRTIIRKPVPPENDPAVAASLMNDPRYSGKI